MIHLESLTMVVMTGLPGCGKTTDISALLRLVHLTYVDSDTCWKGLFQKPTYSPEESRAVFESVVAAVSRSLSEGNSTIAEGVFASHERIVRLKEIAELQGARFVIVGVQCNAATAFARMNDRREAGGNGPVPAKLWADLRLKLESWRGREQVFWIDTVASTPEHSAQLILQLLLPNEEALPS